ncbi:MAG TPA: hypothetical protein P5052_03910 [Candidatus Paceibacterota bacterium]|nr:hypothetical protein [Candidatus Paceibacterota bacterium]HRZ29858.1 hypothetical protein [Candidatus Paceibacterota bacterium]
MESGIDKLAGNSYDSDNNLNDFIVRNNPDPQNSQSLTEPREDEVDDLSDIGDGFKIKNFNFYYLNNKHERAFIEFDIDQYPF